MPQQAPSKELIGHRIWRQMTELGMKPGELAERMGLSPSAPSHWFAGRSIPRDSDRIHKLLEVLKAPMERIYGATTDAEAELEWLKGIKKTFEGRPDDATEYLRRLGQADHDALLQHLRDTQDR